jgi:predicted Zn finger-like uncharacterized protein
MRIVCPSCQAVYDVPAALRAPSDTRPPAKLRCARCAAEWTPGELERPAAKPPAGPTPSPFADAVAQAMPAPAPPAPVPPVPDPPVKRPPIEQAAPAPRPPRIDPTPPPPAGGTLVAEHLVPARASPRPSAPPPRSTRDSATLLFAWCLSLGVLAALLIAAYLHRADVIAFWPPAARAYDLLGLK